jgi:hypothetical protein
VGSPTLDVVSVLGRGDVVDGGGLEVVPKLDKRVDGDSRSDQHGRDLSDCYDPVVAANSCVRLLEVVDELERLLLELFVVHDGVLTRIGLVSLYPM